MTLVVVVELLIFNKTLITCLFILFAEKWKGRTIIPEGEYKVKNVFLQAEVPSRLRKRK